MQVGNRDIPEEHKAFGAPTIRGTRNHGRFGIGIALLSAVLIAASACGSSSTGNNADNDKATTSVFEQLNALPADQQESKALELAKKEGGTVALYTSYASEAAPAVKKAFEAKYGIKLELYRANSGQILQRISQEASANKLGADVAEASTTEIVAMADLFAPYDGANRQLVAKNGQFATWTADYLNLMIPAWNTKIIPVTDEPKTWEDLADSRFAGHMILDPGDSDWYAALSLYWQENGKSSAEIDELWKKIAANSKVNKGHSATMELISAGQSGIAAMQYSYITTLTAEKGAPVTYTNSTGKADIPAFARPNGVGILKAAKHPASAWLLTNWILSQDGGQKILAENAQVPSTTKAGEGLLADFTIAEYPTDELIKNQKSWDEKYDELLRGVKK